MGFWEETTVEVTYKGKTTRVAKSDAYIYELKAEKQTKKTTKKEE